MRTNLLHAVRALRLHRGWRQEDLGVRSGVSHQMVSRIERGEIEGITVESLAAVARGLGAQLDVRIIWRGAELDRLIDSRHAGLQEEIARLLRASGWEVRAEVSFNHFGDRGRVDLVAIHSDALLLIVEVKTEIGDLQETLGRLDVKLRLAPAIAKEIGWLAAAAVTSARHFRCSSQSKSGGRTWSVVRAVHGTRPVSGGVAEAPDRPCPERASLVHGPSGFTRSESYLSETGQEAALRTRGVNKAPSMGSRRA